MRTVYADNFRFLNIIYFVFLYSIFKRSTTEVPNARAARAQALVLRSRRLTTNNMVSLTMLVDECLFPAVGSLHVSRSREVFSSVYADNTRGIAMAMLAVKVPRQHYAQRRALQLNSGRLLSPSVRSGDWRCR